MNVGVAGPALTGGPLPAPSSVRGRRVRGAGVALAALLLALGAALSGLAVVSVSHTRPYLAVVRAVPAGSRISDGDVNTVRLAGGAGLAPVPAGRLTQVVGRYAAVPLVPGTLLTQADLTDQPLVGADQVQVGLGIKRTAMPAQQLRSGDRVLLVQTVKLDVATADQPPVLPVQYPAVVVDSATSGPDGDNVISVHVAVATGDAVAVVNLAANDAIGVVLQVAS